MPVLTGIFSYRKYLDSGMDEISFLLDVLDRKEVIEKGMCSNSVYGHLTFDSGHPMLNTFVSSTDPEFEKRLKSNKSIRDEIAFFNELDQRKVL